MKPHSNIYMNQPRPYIKNTSAHVPNVPFRCQYKRHVHRSQDHNPDLPKHKEPNFKRPKSLLSLSHIIFLP